MKAFRVTVDDVVARNRFSPEAAKRARALVVHNVRSDTERFVPYLTGHLSDQSVDLSRAEDGIIAWRAPYAARVYYMKNANWTRFRHPEAGPQWMERSAAVNKERWRKIAAQSFGGK